MSRKIREEIKKLNVMKAQAEAELDALIIKEYNIKREIAVKRGYLTHISQRLANYSKHNAGISVTDHAIVRYVERVMGISKEELIEKILPPEMNSVIENLGSGKFPVNDGEFKIVVKNDAVLTVLTEEMEES